MSDDLSEKRCLPCEGGVEALTPETVKKQVAALQGAWQVNADSTEISRKFEFQNYYHTMAFVNAIAWLAHHENHHPDLEVCYGHCLIRYSTHAIKGLSLNDFICASKVMRIYSQSD